VACRPYPDATTATAPRAVPCRRIAGYLPELLACAADPAVPGTDNAAERSIRPVAVRRTVGGGARSPAGTATSTTPAVLVGTRRARGLGPPACRHLRLDPAPALPA
jgi:hypothetical protein